MGHFNVLGLQGHWVCQMFELKGLIEEAPLPLAAQSPKSRVSSSVVFNVGDIQLQCSGSSESVTQ